MRKVLHDNRLRLELSPRGARRAFTLAELVVSIGILVLMMSLAGQVFNFTVKSTGQATALTQVNQRLRAFEETLREDLRHVEPGNSVLLIQGNPVNVYWTEDDGEADPDGDARPSSGWFPHRNDPDREDESGNLVTPRADILMFYTARKGASYVDPQVTSHLHQVVYGHAELGEYLSSTDDKPDSVHSFPTVDVNGIAYPSPDLPARLAAERWHLARRDTLFLPTPAPAGTGIDYPADYQDDEVDEEQAQSFLERIIQGEVDLVGRFSYEDLVLTPAGTKYWFLPSMLSELPDANNAPYARSRLDPTPPALLGDRLGHYALPNCASFKVEWSLNPRSEFVAGRLDGIKDVLWFDPGDPGDPMRSLADAIARETDARKKAALDSLLTARSPDGSIDPATYAVTGQGIEYSLADRFRGPGFPGADDEYAWPQLAPDTLRPNLVVFTATRPGPRDSSGMYTRVADAVFPGALRITIDVFDEERRLDRPIRHVMVIPIGG